MSKKIFGSLEVQGNLQINGKYAMRIFNGVSPNPNTGDVDFQFFNKSEVDTIMGMLPVSRIGTMDYLPINVSGSFSGASSYSFAHFMQPITIEDDGTAVYLRAGTNGGTYGYYYTYVRDIRNITTLQQSDVVTTNSEYRPEYFTTTQYIVDFYQSNAYEVLFYKTSGSGSDTYALAMTNGTLNQVSHEHAQFPTSTFIDFDPINASVIGDNIFIWGKDTTISNNGYALILYTVPISSVRAGNITGMVRVTGYNGRTIRNTTYSSSPNIRIWDRFSSTVSSDQSLFLLGSGINRVENWQNTDRYNIQCVPNSTNTSVRVAIWLSGRAFTNNTVSPMYGSGFSFVYNISTRTITYDQTIGTPINITTDGTNFTRTDPYQINTTNITGYNLSLGNTGSICQTKDGFLVSNKSRWSSSETYGLSSGSVTPSSLFDSWNLSTRTMVRQSANIAPIFGSAIGENLLGLRFLTQNKFILACAGTENGVTSNYNSYSTTTIGSDRNFTFNSINHGTLNGYSPQERSFVDKSNGDDQFTGMISLIEANGEVSAYASSFIEGYDKPSLGQYDDSTGQFSSTYTLSDTVMQNIKNLIISDAGVTDLVKSLITVYYVPDSSFGNSIAVVKCRTSSDTGIIITSEINLSLSGFDITSASVVSTRVDTGYNNIKDVVVSSISRRYGGLTIAKFSGFNYIGYGSIHNFGIPGDITSHGFIGKIKSGTIQSGRILTQSYIQTGGVDPGVIPGVGFGMYDNSWSDLATKAVFGMYGTTEAQIDGMISDTGTVIERIVITSQEVPQGFNVYFTQEVPVFLGGIFDKLSPVSYDLTSIKSNPANSVFYIYIQMDRTSRAAEYVVTEDLLPESLTSTYIGTIVTGTSAISTISTEKVTRFLTYRPSVVNRGSAIPSSTGVPSGPGTRWN